MGSGFIKDAPTAYHMEKFRPLEHYYIGTVVASDDPKGLGRVKVEIPGLTLGIDVKYLPWYHIMLPVNLGGSMYSQTHFGIPSVNTSVVVIFPTKDIYAGLLIGNILNRVTFPDDKMNLSVDYLHPTSSENHFTENWDKAETKTKDQKHFSPDFGDDYPFSWGWVDPALNWFKVNMMKSTVEFVTNSFMKFKNYSNGDTIVHIPGNLKLVIEKDFYTEVRGNEDHIVFNNKYEHIIGNNLVFSEHMEMREAKRGMKIQARKVVIN
jgi:hypothetical protein